MAGIFGNSMEDRHFERQLNNWLDSQDRMICPKCEEQKSVEDFYVVDSDTKYKCPFCEYEWKEPC